MIPVNLLISAVTHDILRNILPVAAHEPHPMKRQGARMKDLSSGKRTLVLNQNIGQSTLQDFHLLLFFQENFFSGFKPTIQVLKNSDK